MSKMKELFMEKIETIKPQIAEAAYLTSEQIAEYEQLPIYIAAEKWFHRIVENGGEDTFSFYAADTLRKTSDMSITLLEATLASYLKNISEGSSIHDNFFYGGDLTILAAADFYIKTRLKIWNENEFMFYYDMAANETAANEMNEINIRLDNIRMEYENSHLMETSL